MRNLVLMLCVVALIGCQKPEQLNNAESYGDDVVVDNSQVDSVNATIEAEDELQGEVFVSSEPAALTAHSNPDPDSPWITIYSESERLTIYCNEMKEDDRDYDRHHYASFPVCKTIGRIEREDI